MEERGAPLSITKALGPVAGFIAETVGSITGAGLSRPVVADDGRKRAERETVQWVLGRLRALRREGKGEEGQKD
jgi:vacuolar protein sorting-associated protein 51